MHSESQLSRKSFLEAVCAPGHPRTEKSEVADWVSLRCPVGVSGLLTSKSSKESRRPTDRGGLAEALSLVKISVLLDALL